MHSGHGQDHIWASLQSCIMHAKAIMLCPFSISPSHLLAMAHSWCEFCALQDIEKDLGSIISSREDVASLIKVFALRLLAFACKNLKSVAAHEAWISNALCQGSQEKQSIWAMMPKNLPWEARHDTRLLFAHFPVLMIRHYCWQMEDVVAIRALVIF